MAIKQISSGGGEFTITTPASASNRTITLPDATTTLVGTDATQTLTNKTLGATSFTGNALVTSSTAGVGYGTGSGSTVTQLTSRTTAVTINSPTGQITMFTAAGSATWSFFTVNNSIVTETDTVVLSVNGATNGYVVNCQDVRAGSFQIGFYSASGTTSDAPKINFSIIKGATS